MPCLLSRPSMVLCWVVLSSLAARPAEANDESANLVYETHITAIFRDRCFTCHNPRAKKADLDLTQPATVMAGGESGEVVKPRDPDNSLLWEKIHTQEMPPEGDPLTKQEQELVRRWIAEGAKFANPPPLRNQLSQHDVVPILLLRCVACHGGRRKEAGLDVRTKSSLLKGGKSGPAVIEGKPHQSLLIKRIQREEMPPRRKLVSVSVKPMTAAELSTLKEWIRQGMPLSQKPLDVATNSRDAMVTDDDRNFWSFQPPRECVIPPWKDSGRVRNAIDAFVLKRLTELGLDFSPETDRRTLFRRVYFDLIGLPPSPEQAQAYLADESPGAYERLVDRLLASPQYGERWGRHWLDAAGYADSEGAQNQDRVRPHIYRYRDYVIRAFNANKSYARFLHEQIAGDELANYEAAEEVTEDLYHNLAATGFLRTAPDRTFADITNFVPDRLEVIADEIDIFGSAVLGLTIKCARCHSHKFDPIPQRDYYRLAAVFKDAYDEHDWLKTQGLRTLPFVTTEERRRWEQHQQQIERQIAPLKKQRDQTKYEQKKKKLQEQIISLESQKKPEPRIRALWSRGDPSPTYLLKRGDYLSPAQEVGPGPPSVLTDGRTPFHHDVPWPGAKKTGRRLALARWLTMPSHPLTARVMVNRIWKHHFGQGIVRSLDNFGRTGDSPSHPQLLDWLATQFVRSGWSIKAMHRLMLTSTTYRQTSEVSTDLLNADSENRLLSRMPLRRMEGEVLRDSLLHAAAALDLSQFGPADPIEAREDGLVTSQAVGGGWRRSIYVLQRRTKIPTLLENFDFPQMGPNCIERSESVVAPQALHLLNNAMVRQLAERFAQRIQSEAGAARENQIKRVYGIAFGRAPSEEEIRLGTEWLNRFREQWSRHLIKKEQPTVEPALVNYCHAIMNSAEFLYID